MPIESMKKNITFDGSKFWLDDAQIGEIDKELKFKESYDKKLLDKKKAQCLGRIINCEV